MVREILDIREPEMELQRSQNTLPINTPSSRATKRGDKEKIIKGDVGKIEYLRRRKT